MKATLVKTNTVSRVDDPFTTGIPYLPVSLAYLAAALRDQGVETHVVDAFGEALDRTWREKVFQIHGLTPAHGYPRHPG